MKNSLVIENPQDKLVKRGSAVLSDAELLALILSKGVNGDSALIVSRQLINEFGGLRPIFNAEYTVLTRTHGIGIAKYAQLQAALELGRRYLMERLLRDGPLSSPSAAHSYLVSKLRDKRREVFACMFLDTRHYILGYEELFYGTVDGASVHPREIVERALLLGANAVIAVHNHPSGIAEPSQSDEALTRKIQSALSLLDISLLDHIVIGDGECVSLAERGIF